MIEAIIEWSIKNRYIVILAALALGVAGARAALTTPVNAIPDLSENQVIVFTDWMGRSPQEIEDQITYPLSVNLQGLAGVKVVRSSSEFNFSMIIIIFDDSTDYYFARERMLEKLSIASTFLPPGVTPYLAPTPPRSAKSSGIRWKEKAKTWGRCARFKTGTSAINSTAFPAWPKSPRSAAHLASIKSISTRPSFARSTSLSAKSIPPSRDRTRRSAVG